MAEKKNNKKSPFSIYWIYAIIGVAIIGFQLFMSSTGSASLKSENTFLYLAKEGYVEDVLLVNKVRVDFKLTDEGAKFVKSSGKSEYKPLRESLSKGSRMGGKPVFSVKILDAGTFTTQIKELNEELKAEDKPAVEVIPEEEVNYFGQILSFLLPIAILVVIWLFVMRRMTGGSGGGGAGGQIFNIGQSKAKVYEKGETTNITFDDVA